MAERDERMVEAVARALCQTAGRDPDGVASGEPPCWMWELEAEYARAVLALPWLAAALRLAEADAHDDDVRGHRMLHINPWGDEAFAKVMREAVGARAEALAAYRAARRRLHAAASKERGG